MKRRSEDESAIVKRRPAGGERKAKATSATGEGGKKLTIRQRRFVAELAKGKTQQDAAEAAGYTRSTARGATLLKRPCIREALESELEAQGLTPQYLVARIKDLCEANDERQDGRMTPSWIARLKGAELLMRLMGVDRQPDAVDLAFEETVSRMLDDARDFDPGIEVVEIEDSGEGDRTEIVILNDATSPRRPGGRREDKIESKGPYDKRGETLHGPVRAKSCGVGTKDHRSAGENTLRHGKGKERTRGIERKVARASC